MVGRSQTPTRPYSCAGSPPSLPYPAASSTTSAMDHAVVTSQPPRAPLPLSLLNSLIALPCVLHARCLTKSSSGLPVPWEPAILPRLCRMTLKPTEFSSGSQRHSRTWRAIAGSRGTSKLDELIVRRRACSTQGREDDEGSEKRGIRLCCEDG